MKGLKDLKKLYLRFIFSVATFSFSPIFADISSDLDNYLSNIKNRYFNYEERLNQLESRMLRRSWINPISLNYQYSKSNYTILEDSINRSFSIGVKQPIFKFGGIVYGIKYANASKAAKSLGIYKEKRALVTNLIETLYNIKKIDLQKRQLRLIIKNDDIDIKRKREQYQAGIVDSSFLDQAIVKRNQDKTNLLALKLEGEKLRALFSSLSDKNPDKLRIPRLKLIKRKDYEKNHLDIASDVIDIEMKGYNKKITRSKYLPTVSLNANYNNVHTNLPTPGVRSSYHSVGLDISMPININSLTDLEKSKVAYLKSILKLQDDKKKIKSEYDLIIKSINIIDKKIALAKTDEKLYRNILKSTKEQFRAGNKTKWDVETIKNSVKFYRLDRYIYQIEREKQILKLYEKVKRSRVK